MYYKCPKGHTNELDFKDLVILPCPECGESVHKFRALVGNPSTPKEETPSKAKAKNNPFLLITPYKKTIAITLAVLGSLGGIAWFYNPPVKTVASLEAIEAPVAEPQTVETKAEFTNDISQVSVTGFKAVVANGNTKISFTLNNVGNNDFPTLVLHWRGSKSPDVQISKTGYPTTETFTTLPVEFDIAKPADATGVEVKVQYPPKGAL